MGFRFGELVGFGGWGFWVGFEFHISILQGSIDGVVSGSIKCFGLTAPKEDLCGIGLPSFQGRGHDHNDLFS